ncbi:hypothetical protein Tsubulata_006631 [Turnera subulata]|uniref:Uncharacterized protein n=1 Tax=Turnera subulata TaxID=218843 RepID=A0A9Q0FDL7_9ROSI|nr:hypothetical protein Tsubulata_006631 [Turnera subulata]
MAEAGASSDDKLDHHMATHDDTTVRDSVVSIGDHVSCRTSTDDHHPREDMPPAHPNTSSTALKNITDECPNYYTNNKESSSSSSSSGANLVLLGRPSNREVWLWYLYDLCSYFIHTTLVPVLFPLIISQILKLPADSSTNKLINSKGILCGGKQMNLYEALTKRFISVNSSTYSALEWTSLSWGLGLILAAPALVFVSSPLDHGRQPLLIAATAIATGAFFCLPTGFFKVTWIFPPYIALIVAASTVAAASHTRQLGLMVKGFTGPYLQKSNFQLRRGVCSWLSLYATAAGCLGSAIMSAFTYHMLRHKDGRFVSLWVVSIFSGLKWLVGISHVIAIKPGAAPASPPTTPVPHFFSIFKYPHALGAVTAAFISSFTTTCIFISTVLYLLGELCFSPVTILYFWLLYYLLPLFSLPLMQTLQQVIKGNGVKMYLLGFLLSLGTTGVGFYFKGKHWGRSQVLAFAAIQSTSAGVLHAFGRVLVVDCCPQGREGVFSGWYSWGRGVGTCIGFAVASSIPGNISTSYGVAFWTAMAGALLLIYANISDFGGAMAAKHVFTGDHDEEHHRQGKGSPAADDHSLELDSSYAEKKV